MQFTHGVVDTEVIYRRGNERLTHVSLSTQTPTLAELLQIAYTHNLHTLWVCPGSLLSDVATHGYVEILAEVGYEYRVVYRPNAKRGGAEHVTHATLWKKEGTREERKSIRLNFPQWDLWEWEETNTVSILAGIHYLERVLDISISKGPAMAGRELMQQNKKHESWMRQSERDLSTIPFADAGKDCAFNACDIAYTPNTYLHAYDKNSMYLGAAAGASFGAGTPDYYPPGLLHRPNLKLPGLWHCKLEPRKSLYNGITRPSPLYPEQEWLSSPLLKLCIDLGYSIEVLEGYQWTEYHRVLESYSNTLWPIRQSFKTDTTSYPHAGGRAVAYDGIKRIATTGVGLLNADSSKKYAPLWYRPDMWVGVVELAKERLLRQVIQIEEKYGLSPIGIATDCLYYLSFESNPHTAIPNITARAEQLGGYKVKHSFLLTPELVHAMNAIDSGGGLAKVVREYDESLQKAE